MNPISPRPDLCRIGESAFTEVLATLLTLPVTGQFSSNQIPAAEASGQIAGAVRLAGPALHGSVQIRLPPGFVADAVNLMTGHDAAGEEANALLDDAVGEITNMVAGRVAVQLTACGYACTMGTPSVFRTAGWPIEAEPGADHGRTELFCNGHRLSLEVQCCYTVQ